MIFSRQARLLTLCSALSTSAFTVSRDVSRTSSQLNVQSTDTRGKGFGVLQEESTSVEKESEHAQQEQLELATMDTEQVKEKLLDLLPRMTGTPEESRLVEAYVNTLEERYTPVQTLDFLNFAMCGEWQLLFSTNFAGGPRPNFRLRELFQRVEADNLEGIVTNEATWDLAEDGPTFESTGTFSVKCSYQINQGSRMVMELEDHVLSPARGSKLPQDVPALVGLLHRIMPKELFDPNDHAMDTTYLDGDTRIVRMTGPKFEGVRDIFIRRGRMEINPTKAIDTGTGVWS
jgi:hypothetical protein